MKVFKSADKLIDHLKKELKLKNGDTINIATPQFDRGYDIEIDFKPSTREEMDLIVNTASRDNLIKMGFGVWSEKNNKVHYLFPHEWYDHIPDGYPLISVMDRKYNFKHGETDSDRRFGCLAYGFIRKES